MAKKKTENVQEETKLSEEIKSLEKDYGKGVVIGGRDKPNYTDVVSTGSIGLDAALGIGGLPLGKIVELIGWESSGKSTLTLHLIANAQKKGLKCLLIDGENSFDEKYARALGVIPEDMLYVQLDEKGGERAYEIASRLIQTGEIQLCIVDSVNALQPKKVLLEGLSASTMGLHSRMMGQVMPQFNLITMKNNCLCVFISQIREKIGVMFGSPETTQGGNALKFYAHIRIDVRKSVLKEGDEAYANKTRVKVTKNKMAPPFKTAEFNINFGEGIDRVDEIINLGTSTGLMKKWGKQVTFLIEGGAKYDIDEFATVLRDNEEFYNDIKGQIIERLKNTSQEKQEEEI